MNVSRMKKAELIAELEKRSLPTNGLKDELKSRLIEAIEKEKGADIINVDDSDESHEEIENMIAGGQIEKDVNVEDIHTNFAEITEETLKEDEIIAADQSTVLTVEDAIKMKTPHEIESDSMIVNINEDDENDSMSNSPSNDNVNSVQTINNNNRELDNGDHEIIEISEEVVIDDEDNQENDNNYNDLSSDSNQLQSRDVESEVEKIESRKEDLTKIHTKAEIWVTNIAEDVKAVELKELFGKFGKVVSAKVVMNAKNPSGSCFGCIQLASANDANECILNLDQTEFRGNIISITNDMNDKAVSKEKIIRNVSPVSSSASWGSKKKSGDRKLSQSPIDSSAPSFNKTRNDPVDKDRRPPYREKPNTGSGFYKTKEFSDRGSMNRRGNRPQYNDDRRQNYSDKTGRRPYYKGSSSTNYNAGSGKSYNDSGNRDTFPKSRDSRDNYNSQSYESRYAPSNSGRDRPPGRTDYGSDRLNKAQVNYNDYRSRPNKYDSYDDYDRRDKRSTYDRPVAREVDNYISSTKRDVYKRSRPEDSDDYLHSKKRKSDLISDKPHYYRNVDSPKKSYYSEKDFRKPEYKSRRDDYPGDYPSKSDRDFFPARRNADYPVRREAYDGYSPERHATRSNHYSKDSYTQHSTDFGGRSRRY